MDACTIVMDGVEIAAKKGATILEAAGLAGIAIPTLCHHPDLRPGGSCRICVVEIEGSNRLAGACHTPIAAGMVVHTRSPGVLSARKATVELLLAGHTGPCVNDARAAFCALHRLASDLEVGPPRFRVRKPRHYPPEDANPHVRRDLSKCILCSRCVSVCRDLAGKDFFATAYRGIRSKVVVDYDGPLCREACRGCLLCIEYCPTGALSRPGRADAEKMAAPPGRTAPPTDEPDRARSALLPALEQAQRDFHCVPREFAADTAQSLGLSVSDVYGVATFYSFLSTRPRGVNVIRVCKSLPCHLKNSGGVLESIRELLGIGPGETTPDSLFSLELANCIGACDRAPAMMINDEVYGDLTPKKISRILRSFAGTSPAGGA